MTRRRRWSLIIILCAFAVPLALMALSVLLDSTMGNETHRSKGIYAARFRGMELVIWKYNTRWMHVDFAELIPSLFECAFATAVFIIVGNQVIDSRERRNQRRSGFEVILQPGAPPAPKLESADPSGRESVGN